MGYYGRSMYRGDFYRGAGDFYRGARGDFWDDAGTVIGKIANFVPDVVTRYAGGVAKALVPGYPALSPPMQLPTLPAFGPSVTLPGGVGGGVKVGRGKPGSRPIEIYRTPQDREDGIVRRRMNACNPKALRRAMRRTSAFMGFAKKYVKLVNPKVHIELRHKPLKHHRKA